jgi:hypothetical protein
VAIALGGVIRDTMLLAPGQSGLAAPYIPVFALEAALLAAALVVALPLVRQGRRKGLDRIDPSAILDERAGAPTLIGAAATGK